MAQLQINAEMSSALGAVGMNPEAAASIGMPGGYGIGGAARAAVSPSLRSAIAGPALAINLTFANMRSTMSSYAALQTHTASATQALSAKLWGEGRRLAQMRVLQEVAFDPRLPWGIRMSALKPYLKNITPEEFVNGLKGFVGKKWNQLGVVGGTGLGASIAAPGPASAAQAPAPEEALSPMGSINGAPAIGLPIDHVEEDFPSGLLAISDVGDFGGGGGFSGFGGTASFGHLHGTVGIMGYAGVAPSLAGVRGISQYTGMPVNFVEAGVGPGGVNAGPVGAMGAADVGPQSG